MQKLKVNDTVQLLAGKDKGKKGKIKTINFKTNRVVVEGVNVVKKALKPNQANPQGGILEITKPINVSKVGIVDPTAKKASRIGFTINKDGTRSRIFKASGKEIK